MCAACHQREGVVDYNGDLLCSRCGGMREWAFVISMIQDRLSDGSAQSPALASAGNDVAADPFAAA
jgi:hypothetical protein